MTNSIIPFCIIFIKNRGNIKKPVKPFYVSMLSMIPLPGFRYAKVPVCPKRSNS